MMITTPQRVIYEEAMRVRRLHNRPIQKLDEQLCIKAQEYAEWMARIGVFQHSNTKLEIPDEIIAASSAYNDEPKDCIADWFGSPPHYSWLMGDADSCGFGYASVVGPQRFKYNTFYVGNYPNGYKPGPLPKPQQINWWKILQNLLGKKIRGV